MWLLQLLKASTTIIITRALSPLKTDLYEAILVAAFFYSSKVTRVHQTFGCSFVFSPLDSKVPNDL